VGLMIQSVHLFTRGSIPEAKGVSSCISIWPGSPEIEETSVITLPISSWKKTKLKLQGW
jgi:hypothetical protein